MAQLDAEPSDAARRRPGRPRTIDRERIVAVARTLDPKNITMQAVADQLGVNRKALSYHVRDRDGLLRLVAADTFAAHFGAGFDAYRHGTDVRATGDWRNSIRGWAFAVRDGVVAAGVAADYFRISGEDPAIFGPVEIVLQDMLSAGYDIETASRGMIFVTRFAMGVGRDVVMEETTGTHPQEIEVRRILDDGIDGERYQAFRWMASAGLNGPADIAQQFEFELEVFLDGMERRLTTEHGKRTT